MAAGQKHSKFKELKLTFATAIAAAFGFVMALSWNDALKAVVDQFLVTFGLSGQEYVYKLVAAIIVTIIAVIGIWITARWRKQ